MKKFYLLFSSPFGGIIIKSAERSYHEKILLTVLVPFRGNHYQIRASLDFLRALLTAFSSPFGGIIIKSFINPRYEYRIE